MVHGVTQSFMIKCYCIQYDDICLSCVLYNVKVFEKLLR